MPALRDKTTIGPMEWVSLDGRTKDFWAHNGDGKPRRYTFFALVDCATNFILGWTLAESENARATQALIKRVCQTWGIFDRLYPDNGSAFAGHLVAGGAVKRFRNSGAKMAGVKPLGICHHLGIAIHFALPGNGQAKTAERTFASLSRVLDDRPEIKGDKPTAQVAPYVEVLGAELAITFILTFGGSQIYLAADPGGRSAVERLVGHDRAKALGEDHRLQMVPTVPLARKWLVLMLAWQGQPHAQIARTVRVATATVRRYVKEAAE